MVYVCDMQTSEIEIGELFSAFSIHEKHQTYDYCNPSGEIVRVGRCLQVLEENVAAIRELNCRLLLSLNWL